MNMPQASASRPFTGRHMAIIMVSFFAVVFGVNAALVVFASKSWTGLVVQNSYVASQSFDADTRKLTQSAAMGLQSNVSYAGGKIVLHLADPAANALQASKVLLTIGISSSDREDRTLLLQPVSPGVFAVETTLKPGRWDGVLTADVAGRGAWQRTVRLHVEQGAAP